VNQVMIEDGQEWYGYGFMSDHSDPNAVELQFMENVRYLEYYGGQIGLEKRGMTLAKKISALFDRLPPDCEDDITDCREGMIREAVDFRNRTAHGRYDSPRPTSERLLALSIKLAALLQLCETLDAIGRDAASSLSKRGSPFLRSMLALSDRATSGKASGS